MGDEGEKKGDRGEKKGRREEDGKGDGGLVGLRYPGAVEGR